MIYPPSIVDVLQYLVAEFCALVRDYNSWHAVFIDPSFRNSASDCLSCFVWDDPDSGDLCEGIGHDTDHFRDRGGVWLCALEWSEEINMNAIIWAACFWEWL